MNTIRVKRKPEEDASQAAGRAARLAGTSLSGNLRWYGLVGPHHREIGTADGRTVVVYEPDSLVPELLQSLPRTAVGDMGQTLGALGTDEEDSGFFDAHVGPTFQDPGNEENEEDEG